MIINTQASKTKGSKTDLWPSNIMTCVTNQDLVQKVLNELLLQGSRGQESVKISAEKLSHKIAVYDAKSEC